MSSEELAPSSLKSRRVERQNKYFKEQVLMKEETKIITKTHKGESIISVNKETHDEMDLVNESIPVQNRNQDNSDKASWDSANDNEERRKTLENNNGVKNSNSNNISIKQNQHTSSNQASSNKKSKMKFKNLTQENINFHNFLEEFTIENLRNKFNEKLRSQLKPNTVAEINKGREEIK